MGSVHRRHPWSVGTWTRNPATNPPSSEPVPPTIRVSLEHTGDLPSIPFLNINVMVTQDGSITIELYVKPTHSGIPIHYDSAHPKSLKDATAQSQLQRALRVFNTPSWSTRIVKTTSTLEKNGYPVNTITRVRKRANTCTTKEKPKDDYDKLLTLPCISDEISFKIKRAVKKSGLNIWIAQWSGPTLRSIHSRSALELPSCPSCSPCIACQTGLQGCCTTKERGVQSWNAFCAKRATWVEWRDRFRRE